MAHFLYIIEIYYFYLLYSPPAYEKPLLDANEPHRSRRPGALVVMVQGDSRSMGCMSLGDRQWHPS